MPNSCAIAGRCSKQFVLPEIAACTKIAFSKLSIVTISDVRPAGRWPAECFYYAGGVPAIMEEIKEHLHLDVMTVTGKTLGENLDELRANGF